MKDQKIHASKFLSLVLSIASERMNKDGHLFFRSANGVWLTERVPVEYIEFPAQERSSR